MNPRTRMLLEGRILPTLLRLAWPNLLVMLAQSAIGLVETWFVSRLGTNALAGMALVFPGYMMMQMLSGGAVGGGISSAVARALGAGKTGDGNALVLHAILVNVALGVTFTVMFLFFGRPLYAAMGGRGASLDAALQYSDIVFAGAVLVWLFNALASVLRGTGNMWMPALAICAGFLFLLPLSPALIFGMGPVSPLGVPGAGLAVILSLLVSNAVLVWYLWSGRSVVRPVLARLRASLFIDILRVGAAGSVSTLQTTLVFVATTALVGSVAGPGAVAGYGTGARLEYLLIPLAFGIGAPLVAMVGTNIGAGQRQHALRVALTGALVAFVVTEAIGVAAALWPRVWLGLFGNDVTMIETGSDYLRIVGPTYGFFGLGLSLYFASQGAGRLAWPLLSGTVRLVISVVGGYLAYKSTHSLSWLFGALSSGLFVYGVLLTSAIASGVWFDAPLRAGPERLSRSLRPRA